MSPPIRSFLNLLALASVAGVLFWREHSWQVRLRASGAAGQSAAGTLAASPASGVSASPVGSPPTPQQEAEMLTTNAALQRRIMEADARMSAMTTEIEALKKSLADARPQPVPADLAKQFQEQRGLAFDPPPAWTPVALDVIMEKIRTGVEQQLPVDAAQARSRAAVAMGFHSDPFDYLAATVSLAQMTNGGIYDAGSNTFFYREEASLNRADGRETFISGLSSALTLQKGQGTANIYNSPNDDAALALRSLMSGDANASRVRFSIADQLNLNFDRAGAPASPAPNYSAPVYLAEIWKFSQDKGSLFAEALAGQGGNAAVDAAYARPPQSSAEILHPELLYQANPPFQPIAVDFKDPAIAGTAPYFSNVAGELGTYIALRSWLGVDESTVASEGWAGDRYVAWPGTEGVGDHVFWKTVWTSEKDAREFFDQLRRVVMMRFSIPWRKVYDATPGQFRVDDPARIVRLVLQPDGRTVTLLNATDPVFATALEQTAAGW